MRIETLRWGYTFTKFEMGDLWFYRCLVIATIVWCHIIQAKNITSTLLQIKVLTLPTDEGITEQSRCVLMTIVIFGYARKNTIFG